MPSTTSALKAYTTKNDPDTAHHHIDITVGRVPGLTPQRTRKSFSQTLADRLQNRTAHKDYVSL